MLRAILLIVRKDLTVEVRSRELAYTTLFFAVSCVLVFAFSLVQEGRAAEGVGAGVLWMAIMFAGNLALGRTFERERQSETLRALMLVPAPRPAVYLGKLTGIVLLLAITEAVSATNRVGELPRSAAARDHGSRARAACCVAL